MGGVYRKKGGARELLTSERIICGLNFFLFGWERDREVFLLCRLPLSKGREGEMEKASETGTLIGA